MSWPPCSGCASRYSSRIPYQLEAALVSLSVELEVAMCHQIQCLVLKKHFVFFFFFFPLSLPAKQYFPEDVSQSSVIYIADVEKDHTKESS